ncbi:MAG: acylphosphatase [Candidatus Micrarchaeia archaeon]
MIYARIIARGRVQGVFYRAAVRDIAKRIGVHGYVRNLPERDKVEIVCECNSEKELRELCEAINIKEDDGIYVSEISVVEKRAIQIGNYTNFDIRYY